MLLKCRNYLKKDFSDAEIINFIIYMMIIVMPFIISRKLSPNYLMGKVVFTYVMGTLLLFLLVRDNFKKIKDVCKIKIKFEKKSFTKENIKIFFSKKLEEKSILTMFLAMLFSTLFSIEITVALLGNKNRYEGIIIWTIYFLLFIAAKEYMKINKKMIEFICIIASIMAIHSVLQLHNIDPVYKFFKGSVDGVLEFGTIGNRNFLSTYLLIFQAIAMGCFIFYKNNRYLIYSSIIFAGVLSGQTRGVWVGFIVMSFVGLMFIIKDKDKLKKAVVIFACFSAILGGLNYTSKGEILGRMKTINGDINNIVSADDKKLADIGSGRGRIWSMTMKSLKKHPIMGTGPDTLHNRLFRDVKEDFLLMIIKTGTYPDKAHNEYLEYWATGGLLTLVSYLCLVGTILLNLFRKKKDDISKIFILVIVGYLVQAFFNISVIQVAPIYWIVLGLAVAHYRKGIFNR